MLSMVRRTLSTDTVLFVEAIPRLGSGKIDRTLALAMLATASGSAGADPTSQGST